MPYPASRRRSRRSRTIAAELLEHRLLLSGQPIAGSLWNDQDFDGVRDAAEPPLAGWTVYLDADNDGQLDPGISQGLNPQHFRLAGGGIDLGWVDANQAQLAVFLRKCEQLPAQRQGSAQEEGFIQLALTAAAQLPDQLARIQLHRLELAVVNQVGRLTELRLAAELASQRSRSPATPHFRLGPDTRLYENATLGALARPEKKDT